MGWTTGYTARDGTPREIITRVYQGDPTSCASCSFGESSHPRVSGSEYTAIYGPRPASEPLPAAHEFTAYVPRYRVLDVAIVALSEAYLAVETIETGAVWAGVALVSMRRGDFGYKDMSEEMGPGIDRCPARILDRLTPTDSDSANEWRARCRARLGRPKVAPGARVEFARPIGFSDGSNLTRFQYVKGSTFRAIEFDGISSTLYRISNWRDMAHTVA